MSCASALPPSVRVALHVIAAQVVGRDRPAATGQVILQRSSGRPTREWQVYVAEAGCSRLACVLPDEDVWPLAAEGLLAEVISDNPDLLELTNAGLAAYWELLHAPLVNAGGQPPPTPSCARSHPAVGPGLRR